jgi:hypothetical protein
MLHFNTVGPLRLKSIKRLEEGSDALILTDGGLEQLKEGLEFWIAKTQIVSQCVPGLYCVQPENMTPMA